MTFVLYVQFCVGVAAVDHFTIIMITKNRGSLKVNFIRQCYTSMLSQSGVIMRDFCATN